MECEVCIDGIHLEQFSEFKVLGMCFGQIKYSRVGRCNRKVVSRRREAGAFSFWLML